MSLKRLCISIAAAALLAVGVAACGGGDTETVTVQAQSGDESPASGTDSGKKIKMIASVPPTDHGWLGAISKNAKTAAEQYDDVDFQLLQAADDLPPQKARAAEHRDAIGHARSPPGTSPRLSPS